MTSLVISPEAPNVPAGSGRALAETSISLPAPELGRMLANVSLAAAKDDGRPALTCVRLSYDEGKLTATATDSYWLLRETLPVEYATGPAFVALLPVADLAPIVKVAKSRAAKAADAVIVFDGEQVTFKVDGLKAWVTPFDDQYPNVDAIIDGLGGTETASVAFMCAHLAKVAKVVPGSTAGQSPNGYPVRFMLDGPLRAIRAEWHAGPGADLFAIVMPTRVS